MEALLISIGGAAGAVLRYEVGQIVGQRRFPWSTLVVNAVGSFILGLAVFGLDNSEASLLVGVGFCGAFTTYSSFSYQTIELWEQEKQIQAVVNALGNLFLGLIGFVTAWFILEISI